MTPQCQLVAADPNLHGIWYASDEAVDSGERTVATICWIDVNAGNITDVNINLW